MRLPCSESQILGYVQYTKPQQDRQAPDLRFIEEQVDSVKMLATYPFVLKAVRGNVYEDIDVWSSE